MQKLIPLILCSVFFMSGCASQKHLRKIEMLEREVSLLNKELDESRKNKDYEIHKLKSSNTRMEQAKRELERKLKSEINDYKAKLEMTERGLVITFLDEIFFDSGKAKLQDAAKQNLRDVASVLNKEVDGYKVAIEGHTDNIPIKYSGWKSNWELASARALAVLHFFVNECQIDPARLSANSYGEYQAVSGNETKEGRSKNRRVEITILPPMLEKIK